MPLINTIHARHTFLRIAPFPFLAFADGTSLQVNDGPIGTFRKKKRPSRHKEGLVCRSSFHTA